MTVLVIGFRSAIQKGVLLGILLLLSAAGGFSYVRHADSLQLQNRTLKLADSRAGSSTLYSVSFQHQAAGPVGSVRLQFCANDPFPGQACVAPTGFSASGASLQSQSGLVGFSLGASLAPNEVILTRTPAAVPVAVTSTYEFNGVINPSSSGSFFVRLESFTSTDATGASVDYGGLAFRINGGLSVNVTVPPFLLFCSGNQIPTYDCASAVGNYVDFGDFSPTRSSTGQTQLLVATNAEFGYTIAVGGTTLTSGVNTITGLSVPDVSRKGVSQFGFNLRANGTPPAGQDPQGTGVAAISAGYDTPNFYKFQPGDVIASSSTSDAYRRFTVNYVINVSPAQPAGIYVSTLTYVAVASF
ncbi:hypothetical protein JNM87_00715 [Candidatus Saccharibacteria bacterium]|nr:hypothetical protein [Candidatus Saccharibacteria bacterium]